MKMTKQFTCLIACFAILCCGGCVPEKTEQKEVTVDILMTSNPESSSLPEDLQNLFAPEMSLPDINNIITIIVPTGKIRREDLTTPLELNVKYEKTKLAKIQEQLKKTNAEEIRNSLTNYLSGVDVTSLNSNEQVENEEKSNRIRDYIQKQQGDIEVLFYAENIQNASWDNYSVYHDIGSIRELVFESQNSNSKNKFLIVYNPPLFAINTFPEGIMLDKTSLVFEKAGGSEQLNANVYPADIPELNKKVIWMSENEKVATVDATGLVKAIAQGNAIISANTENGFSASCSIQVKTNNPTTAQLNDLFNKIKNSDDSAIDKIRSILRNDLPVEGAANISNVQQLITDISNGSLYSVIRVNTNADGKVVSISVIKQL